MAGNVERLRLDALGQAQELLRAIEAAEEIIVSTIERECDALRSGQMLAAKALRTRLGDSARLYLSAMRAARASVAGLEQVAPGIGNLLHERRRQFACLLRVELGVLASERAAAGGVAERAVRSPRRRGLVSIGAGGDGRRREQPALDLLVIDGDGSRPRFSRRRFQRRRAG